MNAQDIMEAARLTRVRELQTQLSRAAAENSRLAEENAELKAHFDLALVAAEDLRTLPTDGRLVIVDGWNVILGAVPPGGVASARVQPCCGQTAPDRSLGLRRAHDPKGLIAEAKVYLKAHPLDFVWIVFDGPRESVRTVTVDGSDRPRLRVSYTGGIGAHRADRFICDFLRMAKFRGTLDRIVVQTRDKDFLKDVGRLAVSRTSKF